MKKFYTIFLALVLVLAMVVPVGVVSAGSGQLEVNGEISFVAIGFEIDKIVGNNGVIKGTLEHNVTYAGDIAGTAFESLSFSLNPIRGEFPNYQVTSKGIQTFEGTILGQSGTFTANVRHQMKLDGSGKVEQTIVSGTGDFANLHGTLIFTIYSQVDGSYAGAYSGKLHFAP